MKYRKLSHFYETDYVDSASYDNLRKIASCIDGLKNTSRKVIYTILEKNIKSEIKVSQLNSKMAEFADYLHGSAEGVISNLGQNFTGTNNVPLLVAEGNFGTRFKPAASAPRYIYTHGHDNLWGLFNKDDNKILIEQYFEGEKIEPMFYVPNLPVLLLNGSEGVSSGFAQKILPRKKEEIIKYIENKLTGSKKRPDLTPYYEGFSGTVDSPAPGKWEINGVVKRLSSTRVEITEVPPGVPLNDTKVGMSDRKGYISILNDLKDNKVITDYTDKSEKSFHFIVNIPSKVLSAISDYELLEKLKLINKVTENYTCIDRNNEIIVFDNIESLLDYYIDIKQEYLGLRKDYILGKLDKQTRIAESKYNFIMAKLSGEVIVDKKTKKQIIEQLDGRDDIIKVGDNYDYVLNLPQHATSKDTLKVIKDNVTIYNKKLKELKSKKISDLWLEDLSLI
jgi:DNA topoisomerase-2